MSYHSVMTIIIGEEELKQLPLVTAAAAAKKQKKKSQRGSFLWTRRRTEKELSRSPLTHIIVNI